VGNPFLEDTGHLISLDTSRIMPDDVVDTVRNISKIGKEK